MLFAKINPLMKTIRFRKISAIIALLSGQQQGDDVRFRPALARPVFEIPVA
jgi:hypothetical protein